MSFFLKAEDGIREADVTGFKTCALRISLPIWVCQGCEAKRSVGSVEELRREGAKLPEPLDRHRPYIDEVTLKCSCGGEMRRIPELADVWFDSGSMPFDQWHYPFENQETFQHAFPT